MSNYKPPGMQVRSKKWQHCFYDITAKGQKELA